MEGTRKASEEKVCHTCGHAGIVESIATCSLCRAAYEHTYCMNFVRYDVPNDWCCEECLRSAEVVSNVNLTTHQLSQKSTLRNNVAGKVKFITNEEAAALTVTEKMSHGKGNRSASGHHGDFAHVKPHPLSWKKVTSTLPRSKAIKVPFRPKKGPDYAGVNISASQHTVKSEPFKKEKERERAVRACEMKPIKGKAIAAAYNSLETSSKPKVDITDSLCADDGLKSMVDKHIDEPANTSLAIKGERALHKKSNASVLPINDSENKAPLKGQDLYLTKDEEPNASLAKEGRNFHKKRDANTLPTNDSGTAVLSIPQCTQILSQKMVPPVKLIISLDEKHLHATEVCWRGAFEVLEDFGTQFHGTVNAHLSCQVSPKVYDVSKHLPRTLQFKMLARESVWPKIFKLDPPTRDDVALYFKCEVERHKENYAYFIQHIDSNDYALQGCIADAELLLFTSAKLQIDSQCFNGDIYLWGVFRHLKEKKQAGHGEENAVSFSPATPTTHTTHDHSKVLLKVSASEVAMEVDKLQGSSLKSEVEMEIDMIGGCSMGRIDVAIKREDNPCRCSKPIQSSPTTFSIKKSSEHLDFPSPPPGFSFPAFRRSVPAPPGKSTLVSSGTSRNHALADPTGN